MATPSFHTLTEKGYTRRVCTPAARSSYFTSFHLPALEYAVWKARKGINVLDIACGNGSQSTFFKEYADVKMLVGVDISRQMAKKAKEHDPGYEFVVSDVSSMPIRDNSFQLAIAVNAMIYKPQDMLNAMFDALAPGGVAVMNFRLAGREENAGYFEMAAWNAEPVGSRVDVGGPVFRLYGLDDSRMRGIGNLQSYFYDIEQVLQFIKTVSSVRKAKGNGEIAVAAVGEYQFWHSIGDVEFTNLNHIIFAQKPSDATGRADLSLTEHLLDRIGGRHTF